MYRIASLAISLLLLGTPVLAVEGKTESGDSIRFLVTPRTPNDILTDKQFREFETMGYAHPASENPPKGKSYLETTAKELRELLTRVREATCKAIGTGSFKISVGMDASGKILGIGASGSSGLEVSVQCGKSEPSS